jgi:GAF domain-containing protein
MLDRKEAAMADASDPKRCLLRLQKVAHALGELIDEPEIVRALLDEATAAVGATRALLRLLGADGDELLLAGAVGLSDAYQTKGAVCVGRSPIDQQVLDAQVVTVADVTTERGLQYPDQARIEGLRGVVAVPLTVRQRVIGVLRVFVDDASTVTDEVRIYLSTVCDLAALAIEKARLHRLLFRFSEALNASFEIGPMLERAMAITVEEMGLKAAGVRLLDPKGATLRLVASHGLSARYLAKGDVHLDQSPIDQQALAGEPVVARDLASTAPTLFEHPEAAVAEGIDSVLVVPLKLHGRAIGVLRAYSARPRPFGRVAINFLSSVAGLVALAIEKAQLYAREQERAERAKTDLTELYKYLALG